MPANTLSPTALPAIWRRPIQHLRARWRRWWLHRLPAADSVVLTQRLVYVLPSRAGLMLAATLLVLLATAINYQLNLGYLLTFLLAGCAAVSLHLCHGTLRGLQLNLLAPAPQFAGSAAALQLRLHNPRRRGRYGIGLSVWGENRWVWTNVPSQGSANVQLAFAPARRGLQPLPLLTAETRFPLGTFRVWSLWRPAAELLVYPAPEAAAPPLPSGEPRDGTATQAPRQQGGEHDGLRAYRRGDPLKRVVWKKMAKTGELVSRDETRAQAMVLWLDLRLTGLTDAERQLSRLCAWVLQAERLGLDYGLRLGAVSLGPDQGEMHKQRCLEALARY
jgi:uncharacterized protein (DUF58 family)